MLRSVAVVWDPARIHPQSWSALEGFYRRLEDRNHDFGPLRSLVEHIASRPYAPSIFGATSVTALLVAQRADADWAHDALRIDLDLSSTVRFFFAGKPIPYASERHSAVDGFDAFVRKAGWDS